MHIELIGCTSAGKSTLSHSIVQACREQKIDIVLGNDFVLKQIGLHRLKGHLPRTLLVDLLSLSACLIAWRNHLEFYRFATQLLFQLPIAPLEKLNLLRNVLKKIGIYEIIRLRSTDQQIILVDEGILQAAHNLFVHVSVPVDMEKLAVFAKLIPLPDVIVYLRQPESLLIGRTMKRGHQRIPDCSYGSVVPFIKRAVATFETLVRHPAVKSKVLIVDGSQNVTMATHHGDNPIFDRAWEILEIGMSMENLASLWIDP